MLQLISLRISGFRSIKDEVFVTLPKGAFLIEGETGSGKTSLFREAAFFLLFGKNLRGEYVANVVNRESEKAIVVGEFEIPGIGRATATRTRTPTSSPPFTFVAADGRDLLTDAGTMNSWLTDPVERLLGMRLATVKASSFYSPEASLMSLQDTARRELLEDAFGLDWIRDARVKFTAAYNAAEGKSNGLKMELATLTAKATAQKGAAEEFARQAAAAKGRVEANTTAEIERLDAELVERVEKYAQAEVALLLAKGAVRDSKAVLTSVEFQVRNLSQEYNRLANAKAGVDASLRSTVNQQVPLEREYNAVASGQRDACPTCARPFDAIHREEVLKELAAKQVSLAAKAEEFMLESGALTAQMNQLAVATGPGSALAQMLANAQLEEKQATAAENAAENNAAQIDSVIRNVINPALAKLRRAQPNMDDTVRALEASRDRALVEATNAEQAAGISQASLTDVARKLERLTWWKQALGPKGLRAFVLEGLLPQLSKLASYYLGKMSNYELAVEITPTKTTKKGTESETIDIRVFNVRGIDSFEDCSTGERRKADIALTLALYDIAVARGGKGLSYLLLDEALDGISASAAQPVTDLLQDLGANGMSVGVIAHSEDIKGRFDTIMQVARTPAGWTAVRSIVGGIAEALPVVEAVAEVTDPAALARAALNKKIIARAKELGLTTAQRNERVKRVRGSAQSVASLTAVEAEGLYVLLLGETKETK